MRSVPTFLCALCLAACGQSGALYLPPDKPAPAPAAAPAVVPVPENKDEKDAGGDGTAPARPATP